MVSCHVVTREARGNGDEGGEKESSEKEGRRGPSVAEIPSAREEERALDSSKSGQEADSVSGPDAENVNGA